MQTGPDRKFGELIDEVRRWRLFAVVFWSSIVSSTLAWACLIAFGGYTALSLPPFYYLPAFVLTQVIIVWSLDKVLTVSPAIRGWHFGRLRELESAHGLLVAANAVAACIVHKSMVWAAQPSSLLKPVDDGEEAALLFATIVASFVSVAWLLYARRHVLSFPKLQERRWFRFRPLLLPTLRRAVLLAAVSLGLTATLYVAVARWAPWLVSWAASTLSGIELRPDQVPLLGVSLSLGFATRALVLGTLVNANLLVAQQIMQIIYTEKFSFRSDQEEHLQAALSYKSDPLIRHLAFLDLNQVADFYQDRRLQIFRDASGKAWKQVLQQCLAPIDDLAKALQELRSAALTKKPEPAKSRLAQLRRRLAGWIGGATPTAKDPFADLQLQIWAAEALSKLTALSLHEDKIGVVQVNDTIPAALNAMLGCLSLLEDPLVPCAKPHRLTFGVNGDSVTPRPPASVAAAALHNAIYGIVLAFYEHLSFYEFPPKHAQRLQSFVDFRE